MTFRVEWRAWTRRRLLLRLVGAGLAVVGLAVTAAGAARPDQDYTVTAWGGQDGLPASQVNAIAQGPQDYLWLGTDVGLVRFDGVRFVPWTLVSETTLPTGPILALCAGRDGSLWIGFGSYGGVARILDGEVVLYGEDDGLAPGFVNSLVEDGDGTIWAGGLRGVSRFRDGGWQRLGPADGLSAAAHYATFEDRSGRLMIATAAGVFRRSEDREPVFQPARRELAALFGAETLEELERVVGPVANASFALLSDRRATLWLALGGQTLWRSEPGREGEPGVEPFALGTSLSNIDVQAIAEDREGNIWVGSSAGLWQVTPRRVTPFTDLGLVRAIEAGPDGEAWVGTASGVVRMGDQGQSQRFGRADGLPGETVTALHRDAGGTLWVATERGVTRLVDDRFVRPDGLADDRFSWISAITTDVHGDLWICDMSEGLFRYRGGRVERVDVVPEPSRRRLYTALATGAGELWLGFTDGNVGVVQPDGRLRLYTETGVDGTITAIYQGQPDTVWLAANDGLTRVRNGEFVTANRQRNGLPGDAASSIVQDDEGALWVGLNAGIARIRPEEFDEVALRADHQIDYRLYDSTDGLVGMPVRRGMPSAARGDDGRVWFVTGGAAVVFDPASMQQPPVRPTIRVEALTAGGRRFEPIGGLRLPAGSNELSIDYTALTFTSPAKVRFRYRLEGFDSEWIDAGSRRQAFYTNLPPRAYRFEVTAATKEGGWGSEGGVLVFSIAPRFHQTGWFYALTVAGLGLVVWGTWRLRLRQIRRQFSLVLSERARMSRELHDTLLQSLVGTALQLGDVAEEVDQASSPASSRLMRIQDEVERCIREARNSIWDLRSPSLATTDLASGLRETVTRVADSRGVHLDFRVLGVARRCPAKVEEQLLRIGQEAVTNAVRHARAGLIEVTLEYGRTELILRVADDGVGMDVARLPDMTESHYGMSSMQERTAVVNGTFSITSSDGGTTVEVVVPTESSRGQ